MIKNRIKSWLEKYPNVYPGRLTKRDLIRSYKNYIHKRNSLFNYFLSSIKTSLFEVFNNSFLTNMYFNVSNVAFCRIR